MDSANTLGIPVVDPDFIKLLRSRLFSLLKLTRNPDMFPGSQPVSFERKHLDLLERDDYYVCEKSDGIRYLLYYAIPPSGPVAFLIDRNYHFKALENLTLPTRDLKGIQEETLLDGELVWDNSKGELVYYIFDAIMFMTRTLISLDLPSRLQIVQNDIIAPHEKIMTSSSAMQEKYPFKIKLKQMWKPYGLRDLFERVIPGQGHENDGLIFTPVKDGYFAGTCHRLLKWKPSDMNTIDFLIVCTVEGRSIFDINGDDRLAGQEVKVELHIATQGRCHFYTDFDVSKDEELSKLKPAEYCGKIGEFRHLNLGSDLDSDPNTILEKGGRWEFMRFRPDKRLPNDSKTVEKVLHSIKDNVTREDLLKREVAIRTNWKKRETSASASVNTNFGFKSAPPQNNIKPYGTNQTSQYSSYVNKDFDSIIPRSQQEKTVLFKYPLSLSDPLMKEFSWTSSYSLSKTESNEVDADHETDKEEEEKTKEEREKSSVNYRMSISLDYDLNEKEEKEDKESTAATTLDEKDNNSQSPSKTGPKCKKTKTN